MLARFFPFAFSKIIERCLLLSLAVFFASCASVSVDNIQHVTTGAPLAPPVEILILPFTIPPESLRVDREGEELVAFQKDLLARMNRQLAERLSAHVAPARVISPGDALPQGDYWLLTGRFARVNQGSRLLRSTVGLGAGGTKMETLIAVYELSGAMPRKFLRFETTGGSNISQGIGGIVTLPVSGPMALTSLLNAVDGIRSGLSFDTIRTSREITATLSEYLQNHGVLRSKKPLRPKRLGEVPINLPGASKPKKKTPSGGGG